jgi:hypothetical protein
MRMRAEGFCSLIRDLLKLPTTLVLAKENSKKLLARIARQQWPVESSD